MATKTDARFFDILRALAAFCVVCAHVAPVSATSGTAYVLSQILDYLGTMGVPVFFILSGFMFAYNRKPFRVFWKGKLISIVIPWVFCATAVWLYVVLRKGGITLSGWLLFVLGYGHSTYYLTVLMALFLVFWKRTKTWFLYTMAAVSAVSLLLNAWVIDPVFGGVYAQYQYLNVFNWAGYFAVGILLNQKNALPRLKKFASRISVLCLALVGSALYLILCKTSGISCTYFSKFALIGTAFNCIWLVGLASRLESGTEGLVRLLENVGRCSFTIYLLHQLFAGVVMAVTNLIPVGFLVPVRPFVVIALVMLSSYVFKSIFKSDRIRMLIGMRS